MAKKSIAQKRLEKNQQDNQTLMKVLDLFLAGLAAECYLFLVYRGYFTGSIDALLIWDSILRWGMLVGAAAGIGGAVTAFCTRNTNKKLSVAMRWLTGAGIFLAISGWTITRFYDNARGLVSMCVAVPVVTLLGIVYFLFQRECFVSTICLSGATFAVWLCSTALNSPTMGTAVKIGSVLSVVILAVLAAAAAKIRKDNGKLGSFRIFTEDCRYSMLFAALAVSAAGILISLLVPAAAYYLLWVLGLSIFGEMVYFTTKLM